MEAVSEFWLMPVKVLNVNKDTVDKVINALVKVSSSMEINVSFIILGVYLQELYV